MNWTALGSELRTAAKDAHPDELPRVDIAYAYLRANPECFFGEDEEWPEDMPAEPPIDLIAAYYQEPEL